MRISLAASAALVLGIAALMIWSQTKSNIPIEISSSAKASDSLSTVLDLHSTQSVRELPSQTFDAY
jgi:ABC-type nickel/cobalt efflux system permease component RcnA